MRKLIVFNHVSLDGYFVDAAGRMDWARPAQSHNQRDEEWDAFVAENASGDGTLVFGRITYELMIRYWPTPMALQHQPAVAERMNSLRKIVFSRTLDKATWNNTRLIKSDMAGEVRKIKSEPGEGLVILGSGTVVSQLSDERLIDEYHLVVNPVVLGTGRTLFTGTREKLPLKLASSRTFRNGCVFLRYELA